jgi:chemotaxis protein methyltransferase CheR
VRVFGTDINREFLARARSSRFEGWALRGLPDDMRNECFAPADGGWALRPEFARGVSFEYHNLVGHEPLSWPHDRGAFDLILCRNVTIYFAPEIVRRIISHFHEALPAGGWLAVGHAEPNVELFRAFRTVNAPGAVLYQKGDLAEEQRCIEAPAWAWPEPVAAVAPAPESIEPAPEPVRVRPEPRPAPPAPDLCTVRALADRGAWTEAAGACDRLLAADQLNAAAHFYRGLVLEQAGRHADAEAALRRAIYLNRGHVLAHYHLALFLQRCGRPPEAARCFRNALQLLDRAPAGDALAEGDGITAGELAKLVRMHLETLREE